jgi:hypothetical protein
LKRANDSLTSPLNFLDVTFNCDLGPVFRHLRISCISELQSYKSLCPITEITINSCHKSTDLISRESDGLDSIGTSRIGSSQLSIPSHNFFHAPNFETTKLKHEINDSRWSRSNDHYSS